MLTLARSRSFCQTILPMALGYRHLKSTFEIILRPFQSSVATQNLQLHSACRKTRLRFSCGQTPKGEISLEQIPSLWRFLRNVFTGVEGRESVASEPQPHESRAYAGGHGELCPECRAPAYVGSFELLSKYGSAAYVFHAEHWFEGFRNCRN